MMKNPQEITIAISKPPESITQEAYICYEDQKMRILEKIFSDSNPKRVILFSSSKQKVKELAITLKRMKINVAAMHSDLEQSVREQVMKDFKNGHIDILVATDVVARGIDITDISLIINYDTPRDPDDYVHRIGRTARGAEGKGAAITFVSVKDQYHFSKIEKLLGKEIYKIPIDPSFGKTPLYKPEQPKPFSFKGRRGGKPKGSNRRRNSSSRMKATHKKDMNPSLNKGSGHPSLRAGK